MRLFKGSRPPLRGVAFIPGTRTLVTGHEVGIVRCWELDTGAETATLHVPKNPLTGGTRLEGLAVSPDGRLLVAVGDSLSTWDLSTGRVVGTFAAAAELSFTSVTFALGGSRLVAALSMNVAGRVEYDGRGDSIRMWDTATGDRVPTSWAKLGPAGWVTPTPDGRCVVASVWAQYVPRWDLSSGQEYRTKLQNGGSFASSPAAGLVAQGSYRTIDVRDADGNRLLARWDAHKKGVFALAFSPDGKVLVSGGNDEVVKVWDVSQVAEVFRNPDAGPLTRMPERAAFEWGIGPVRAVAFSPDGMTAAAVGDRVKFVVWDLV